VREPEAGDAKTANIAYALIYCLLEELESLHPGTWQKVWERAHDMSISYGNIDVSDDEWFEALKLQSRKVAHHKPVEKPD
jgi:hypothetical protein